MLEKIRSGYLSKKDFPRLCPSVSLKKQRMVSHNDQQNICVQTLKKLYEEQE
jgi:hypothetical protein